MDDKRLRMKTGWGERKERKKEKLGKRELIRSEKRRTKGEMKRKRNMRR